MKECTNMHQSSRRKRRLLRNKYESESGASFTPKINKKNVFSSLKEEKNQIIQRKFEKNAKSNIFSSFSFNI